MSRNIILNHPENLTRDDLVKTLAKRCRVHADGKEDEWIMGLFSEEPKGSDLFTRIFCALGKFTTCADAIADCIARSPKLPNLQLEAHPCEESNNFSF